MVVLLIVMRSLCSRDGILFFATAAFTPRRLLLLFLFWVVAVLTTLFMPHLFYGEVTIIPVRLVLSTFGEPLAPSTQNFSQLAYLTISVFAVFAFARMLRDEALRQHALAAMSLGAVLVVLTGFLDYLSQYVPLDSTLAPFRTASYALMTEVQIMGGKRVVGLMPEASAFGGLCIMFLGMIYFFRHAMTDKRLRERLAPALVFLLLLFVWLSTSSSAYVGLFVFLLMAVIEWGWRKSSRTPGTFGQRGLGFEFWTALSTLVGLGLVILINPGLLDPIIERSTRWSSTRPRPAPTRSAACGPPWAGKRLSTPGAGVWASAPHARPTSPQRCSAIPA